MYCKCGSNVHEVRIKLGYKTCMPCSTTQTYSYVPIIEHKTGNTIQIVSQEVSASVHRAWRRKQLDEWSNQAIATINSAVVLRGRLQRKLGRVTTDEYEGSSPSLVTKCGITSGKVINCWHGGSPIVKVTKITVFGGDLVLT